MDPKQPDTSSSDDWVYSYDKWMNLNSVEDVAGVEPYSGAGENYIQSIDISGMMEATFPELPDGSRDMGNHTIMTREAWVDMLERAKLMMAAPTYKPPVYPEWMARLYSCDRSVERYSIVHPRQYGTQRIYSIIDEWAHMMENSRVDTTRLKDSAYLAELKDRVLEEVAHAGQPPSQPNVYFEMLKRIGA